MHLQKKKSKSGSTSIQIRQRQVRGSKLVETIGCSSNPLVIEELLSKGARRMEILSGQQPLQFDVVKEQELVDIFFNRIEAVSLIGPELC